MFSKSKFLIFTVLIASSMILLVVKGEERRTSSSIMREKQFLHILLAILDDPEFLALDYTEQHKILDDLYKQMSAFTAKEATMDQEKTKDEMGLFRGNRFDAENS